jgi:hypothetical protein
VTIGNTKRGVRGSRASAVRLLPFAPPSLTIHTLLLKYSAIIIIVITATRIGWAGGNEKE